MTLKRSLKIVKNIISVSVLLIMLCEVMFLYFDYSAQIPLIIVSVILVMEYILFIILVKRVRVKLVSRYDNIMSDNKFTLEMLINKRSIYPFKRIEAGIIYLSKYSKNQFKKKVRIELQDRKLQRNIIKTDKLPYGYTDIITEYVYIYDLLGLGSRRIGIYNESLRVFIMPKRKKIDIDLPRIPYIGGEDTDIFLEDRGKDNSELYEIREFRDGDRLRQIHWKLSSKTDEYMVKDSVTPIETNIYVFFDLCNCDEINMILENGVSIAYEILELKYAFYISWLDVQEMRMKRQLVSKENHIRDAVMELMRCPLYDKNEQVMNILRKFSKEGHEIYNLFILS